MNNAAALRTSVRRYADDAFNTLYHRVWCGRVHFGLWEAPDDTIVTASSRVPMVLGERAGLSCNDHLIEVGSGAARAAIDLARTFGCRITATNQSPAHGLLASDAIRTAGLNDLIETAAADAEDLPFKDGLFTAYWAQEVLVHLRDKPAGFREACRVLGPGGRLIFTEQTTDAATMTSAERAHVARRHGADDLWDASDFADAILAAGFKTVDVTDWSPHLARHFQALVDRIDDIRDELDEACGVELVREQQDIWRVAVDLATDGKIGWHLFVAQKS